MARNRLFKSYFYIEYDGQKYLNGGTVIVPPFEATGGTDSFTIHSSKDWEISNKPEWLTLSETEGKRGSTPISLTATTNPDTSQRTGGLHVGVKYFTNVRNIDVDLTQRAVGSEYIYITFTNSLVDASTTSNTFTLDCANIDISTLGYYAAGSSEIVSCNLATSSVTIAENAAYTDKVVTLAITGTSTVGNPITGTAQFTQSKKIVTPSLGITYTGSGESAAAGNTSAFALTKNYITAITSYSVSPSTATITASGQTGLTVQFPANQTESVVQYTVSVSGTDVYGQIKTGSTTFTQAADSYTLSISPASYTAAATDASYNGFTVSSSNVSNTGLSYTGAITGATRTGNNITVNFGQNQTATARTGSVTITGKTVGGRTVSASANLTQNAAGATSLTIVYTGNTLTSQAGSTTAFTVTAQNVTITGYTVDNNATATTITGGVRIDYPANTDGSNTVTYTVTVKALDEFGRTVTDSCQVTQGADTYSFSVTPGAGTVAWDATQATFTASYSNVSNVGYYSPTSENINSCTKNGDVFTASISANQDANQKTIKLVASGNTRAGRTVYATGTTSQDALPDAGSMSVTPDGTQIGSGATSVTFNVAWTGLSAGSQVTFAVSSPITSQPAAINVGNNTTSSATVSVNVSQNTTPSTRNATLTASGIDNRSSARTDSGYYVQAAATYYPSIAWVTTAVTVPAYSGTDATIGFYYNVGYTKSDIDTNTIGVYFTGGDDSWISDDNVYTTAVRFDVGANEEGRESRTITAWISGLGLDNQVYSARCQVTQQAGPIPYLGIYRNGELVPGGYSINLPATGAMVDARFELGWGDIVPASLDFSKTGNITACTWVDAGSKDSVSLTLIANTATSVVTSYVEFTAATVYGETISATLTIIQDEYFNLRISPRGDWIGSGATNVTFTVEWVDLKPNSRISFATSSAITSLVADIFVTEGHTTSSETITLMVSQNNEATNRLARLQGTAESADGSLLLAAGYYTQAAAGTAPYTFSVSPTSLSFGAGTNLTQTITIDDPNGYNWAITNVPNWLSAPTLTGSSSTALTLTATTNTSFARKATITVSETSCGQTTTNISCTQAATMALTVTPVTESPMSWCETGATFKVEWRNLSGTITLTPSIGTVSPQTITAQGTGNENVTVNCSSFDGSGVTDNTQNRVISLSGTCGAISGCSSVEQEPAGGWNITYGGTPSGTTYIVNVHNNTGHGVRLSDLSVYGIGNECGGNLHNCNPLIYSAPAFSVLPTGSSTISAWRSSIDNIMGTNITKIYANWTFKSGAPNSVELQINPSVKLTQSGQGGSVTLSGNLAFVSSNLITLTLS